LSVALRLRNIAHMSMPDECNDDSFAHIPILVKHCSAKMDSITNKTLPATTSSTVSINSFYGPGTWAAWCITLIASWILMLQGSYKHNLNHIGYTLYTNWAAIDMFRHFDWTASATFRAVDFTGTNNASEELSIAVCAVVCVGFLHAFMQSVMCVWRIQREDSKEVKLLIQRRFLILLLGSLMPAWIGLFVVVVWGKRIQLPILGHWTTGFKWALWCLANWIGLNIGDILSNSWYVFPLRISFMGITWVALMLLVFGLPILGSFRPSSKTCYFVPCGAGSLRDWDQAFALFLALFWFTYEHLPALRKMTWRKERRLVNWPGTRSDGQTLPH
jgi:hypothetical protein